MAKIEQREALEVLTKPRPVAIAAIGLDLLSGERDVDFPEGTFPPHGPFVPFAETLLLQPRGQPA